MKNIIQDFFAPIKNTVVEPKEYTKIQNLKKWCNIVSFAINQSIYVIDYSAKEFLYVSPHPLFLCGYTAQEVQQMGYLFYEKVVSEEDLQMLSEINKMGWTQFYSAATVDRNYCISYDFFLHHKNGSQTLVSHKLAVLELAKDNNIWLAICFVGISPNKTSGNVVFTQNNTCKYFTYDFTAKKIISHLPPQLTKREKEVLNLSMQGYNEKQISEKMNVSVLTVKKHRRNLQNKLGVSNMANAVSKFNLSF
ncbi:MAG: helix-turn-helix transcriptional regulator [Prevotellaceae bacterium]|jgi:DNA-binding CsgD family transcriptional regulator|nr:helix-turn-helix transcriptional regulator [Prevotellaceae bacterium]